MIERWDKLSTEAKGAFRIFDVREDRARSPRTQEEMSFYVIEAPDWVNVLPLTPDGQVVCVRQYRHGTEEVTLEIPGGIVDPDDPSPMVAARREMTEETGYEAGEVVPIGSVAPNPAIQNNWCHTFLALGAVPRRDPAPDRFEDIEVVLVDVEEVPSLIAGGRITHALVVSAFYFFDRYAQEHAEVLAAFESAP